MSYCSRSRWRQFTVLDSKTCAYSLIYGHLQQHLYCACAETVIYELPVNLDTAVRFADPDFLLECKISAIWRRFPLIFAFYMLNVRHISTSGLFDLVSILHASTLTSIIPTRLEVDMIIHCRVIAFLSADTSLDLDLWPWTDVIHGQSRDQPCHQVRRSFAYPFLSYEL